MNLKIKGTQAEELKEMFLKVRREETARREEARKAREAREAQAKADRPSIAIKYLIYPNIADPESRIKAIETQQQAHEVTESTEARNGEITPLSKKSFIMLYLNNYLLLGSKNPHTAEATQNREIIEDEAQILTLFNNKNVRRILKLKQTIRTRNGTKARTTPINLIKQVRLTTDQAKTPQAKKFINSFRGSPTEPKQTARGLIKRTYILSYNMISYEDNFIIIIGEAQALRGIINEFKAKNNPKKQYYSFIEKSNTKDRITREAPNQETQLIGGERSPRHKTHLLKIFKAELEAEAEKEDKDKLYKFLNYCLYWSYKTPKNPVITRVRGLNNIKNDEKQYLKARRETNPFKEIARKTQAEQVQFLIEEAHETDGRQTIKNIEYDLNNGLRQYLKPKTSTELYYIIEAVEEAKAPRTKENKTINKKETALLNVLRSYKSTAELNEEEADGLTEELTDLKTQEKGGFKADKKNKNKYSNLIGVQSPNKNPQYLRKILFKSHEAQRKATEKAKAEVQAEKEEERRKRGNRRTTFKELVQYTRNHDHTPQQERLRKHRQQAQTRHRIENETKEYLKTYYSEKQVKKQYFYLKADHKQDFLFIPANEV